MQNPTLNAFDLYFLKRKEIFKDIGNRQCRTCKKSKPENDFHKDANRMRSECKECTNFARRHYRKTTKYAWPEGKE